MADLFAIKFSTWNIVVLAYVLTVAVGDARWRKIPNVLTTGGIVLGLGFHVLYGGLLSSVAALLLAFSVGVAFFQIGAIGGGDVKLMSALGAMLGLSDWLFAMEIAVFAAAIMALFQAAYRGVLRQTLRNVVETFRWVLARGMKKHPTIHVQNPAMLRAPFGVAVALGTLVAVIRL